MSAKPRAMPPLALPACAALLSLFACLAPLHAQSLSALTAQAMDQQLPKPDMQFNGTLPQALADFNDMTGVRIEADRAVYDALPWGELTTFSATFEHQTLRQALDAICVQLGLQYQLQDQTVELYPLPALQRLGRRCTVQELSLLATLRQTPLGDHGPMKITDLLPRVDARLTTTPASIDDRAFTPASTATVNIARNATLLDALDAITNQTPATWYPWGNSIVVQSKPDQIRMQLSRRITTRYADEDVNTVLLDLAHRSGVLMSIQPGAIRDLPPAVRRIKLSLDNCTIQQALESIAGFTGLQYTITPAGVTISAAAPVAGAH